MDLCKVNLCVVTHIQFMIMKWYTVIILIITIIPLITVNGPSIVFCCIQIITHFSLLLSGDKTYNAYFHVFLETICGSSLRSFGNIYTVSYIIARVRKEMYCNIVFTVTEMTRFSVLLRISTTPL